MEARADAVAHQLPHHRVARALRHLLHRMPDISDVIAGARLGDAGHERLLGHAQQPLRLGADVPYRKRGRGVRVQPFERDTDVHAEDLACREHAPRGRDAVDDLRVDGGAQRRGEVVESLEGRPGAGVAADEVFGDAVQVRGRDAGPDVPAHERQRARDDAAGGRHRLDFPCRFDGDAHRPMIRLISSAIWSMVPVPGTWCMTPRWA